MVGHGDVGIVHGPGSEKQRLLRIYNLEILYNHVVNSYVEWQTTVIEAIIRTNSGHVPKHMFLQQERCTWKLSSLLYMAHAYRESQEKKCYCSVCMFAKALRNYLTHNWTRKEGQFVMRGSTWPAGAVIANPSDERVVPSQRWSHGLALYAYLDSATEELRKAASDLGCNDPRTDVVAPIDEYMQCVSRSCKDWRESEPIPEMDDGEHDYERNMFIEIIKDLRGTTSFPLGSIDLYGNPEGKKRE